MISSNNKQLPEWLGVFAQAFKDKSVIAEVTEVEADVVEQEQEKVAEININDLPKVVWKGETFFVLFDDNMATVLNEYGNTVTTIPNVSNIQEVDEILNSKEIVTNEVQVEKTVGDDFEEELRKVSAYMNDGEEQECEDGVCKEDTTATIKEATVVLASQESVNALMDKIANLETMISGLQRTVEALVPQEYAHTDPGAIYDTNAQDAEMAEVQQSEQLSQEVLDAVNSVDLTTMEGRVSLKQMVEDRLNQLNNQEVVVDEVPADVPTDAVEVPVDELAPVDEVVEPTDEVVVEPTEEMVEEVKDDNAQDSVVDEEIALPSVEELEQAEESPENKKQFLERNLILMDSKNVDMFKKQVCPVCQQKKLAKYASTDSAVKIHCHKCKTKYQVHFENENIYKEI